MGNHGTVDALHYLARHHTPGHLADTPYLWRTRTHHDSRVPQALIGHLHPRQQASGAPVPTMTAGYCREPLGAAMFSSGEAARMYGKSVELAGSPYSATHAWPAAPPPARPTHAHALLLNQSQAQ